MAEIRIDSVIGSDVDGWISSRWFADQLKKIPQKEQLVLRINSPGGDVFEATDIYNQILRWKGETIASIESVAASAASHIMLAASTIEVAANAKIMIHEAMRFEYGWHNKTTIKKNSEKDIQVLGMVDQDLAKTYAARSGKKTEEEFHAAMMEETWFNAEQAVEWGLADKVGQPLKVKACVLASWYTKTPENLIDHEAEERHKSAAMAALKNRWRLAKAKST